jgi:hypothetical protein
MRQAISSRPPSHSDAVYYMTYMHGNFPTDFNHKICDFVRTTPRKQVIHETNFNKVNHDYWLVALHLEVLYDGAYNR